MAGKWKWDAGDHLRQLVVPCRARIIATAGTGRRTDRTGFRSDCSIRGSAVFRTSLMKPFSGV
jgi:hypothetical protein